MKTKQVAKHAPAPKAEQKIIDPPKSKALADDLPDLKVIQAHIDSLAENDRRKVMEGANELRGTIRRLGEPHGSDALALVTAEMEVFLRALVTPKELANSPTHHSSLVTHH